MDPPCKVNAVPQTAIVKRSKKYYVHDESNQGQIGDRVRIVETRPLSKLKCWTLAEVISH